MTSLGNPVRNDYASSLREGANTYRQNIDHLKKKNSVVDDRRRAIDLATRKFTELKLNASEKDKSEFEKLIGCGLGFYCTIEKVATASQAIIDQLEKVITRCKAGLSLQDKHIEHLFDMNADIEQPCTRQDALIFGIQDLENKQKEIKYLREQLTGPLTGEIETVLGAAAYALGVAQGNIGLFGGMSSNKSYFDAALAQHKSKQAAEKAAEPAAAPVAEKAAEPVAAPVMVASFAKPPTKSFNSIDEAIFALSASPKQMAAAAKILSKEVHPKAYAQVTQGKPSSSKDIISNPCPNNQATLSVIKE